MKSHCVGRLPVAKEVAQYLHFTAGKSKSKAPRLTNLHYYHVDLYFQVLGMQLKELNGCLNEINIELPVATA
ncbi:hypothetical protein DVH24_001398 [Malus domestica]|uniref:Uncharacterized protein n=1 Tax=Malus domestica TaxID=3750 RepID=A0A498K4G2_MALDO|nr:hypothetical protein DVH24_001398 [Malus domestica]